MAREVRMEGFMADLPRRTFLHAVVSATAAMACRPLAAAPSDAPPAGRRIALSGYDPVSYFTDGRPEKGVNEFWFAFDDAVYLFRNAEHRAMFISDPERFAPQYSGFCAGGVALGYKTEADPEAWFIANDKLYVIQYKDKLPEIKREAAAIAEKADANWLKLRDAPIQ
jgi:hypothetical protein